MSESELSNKERKRIEIQKALEEINRDLLNLYPDATRSGVFRLSKNRNTLLVWIGIGPKPPRVIYMTPNGGSQPQDYSNLRQFFIYVLDVKNLIRHKDSDIPIFNLVNNTYIRCGKATLGKRSIVLVIGDLPNSPYFIGIQSFWKVLAGKMKRSSVWKLSTDT